MVLDDRRPAGCQWPVQWPVAGANWPFRVNYSAQQKRPRRAIWQGMTMAITWARGRAPKHKPRTRTPTLAQPHLKGRSFRRSPALLAWLCFSGAWCTLDSILDFFGPEKLMLYFFKNISRVIFYFNTHVIWLILNFKLIHFTHFFKHQLLYVDHNSLMKAIVSKYQILVISPEAQRYVTDRKYSTLTIKNAGVNTRVWS